MEKGKKLEPGYWRKWSGLAGKEEKKPLDNENGKKKKKVKACELSDSNTEQNNMNRENVIHSLVPPAYVNSLLIIIIIDIELHFNIEMKN